MTITNSTIARNSATEGGGIFNWFKSDLKITKSTVVNNTATAGGGGGIKSEARPRGGVSLQLTNSTVSGNSAAFGGGIDSEDDLYGSTVVYLVNTTVAFNSATQFGGGIAQHVTEDALLSLTNSLVAQNIAPAAPDVRAGGGEDERLSASFSLIRDGTGSGVTNTDGNQVGNVSPYTSPIDPRIGPLADNGGPTRTHALEPDSPALDAASTPQCPATDQRGVSRPQGAGCDIGSYEGE